MHKIITAKSEWETALAAFPEALQDIYFTPAYYALYEQLGQGEAMAFYLENALGKGLYPFLCNAVDYAKESYDIEGCYGYNGPLFEVQDAAFYADFYQAFDQYCQAQNIVAEFTRFHPLLENERAAKPYMTVLYDRATVYVDLEQPSEQIWKKEFSGNNRNMIRKAQRAGISVERAQTKTAFEQFHALYEATMRDLGAADFYFFPAGYFLQIQATIEQAYVYKAVLEGELVGAILVLEYGDYAQALSSRRWQQQRPQKFPTKI